MYDLLFLGIASDGRKISAVVTGNRDPGYGSTCKIICEAADCLIHEGAGAPGGIWTPGAAMGGKADPATDRPCGVDVHARGHLKEIARASQNRDGAPRRLCSLGSATAASRWS